MLARIIINIFFIVTAISAPFWYSLIFFIIFTALFVKPIEVIIYGIFLDVLFFSNNADISIPLYSLVAFTIYFIMESIKPWLRDTHI